MKEELSERLIASLDKVQEYIEATEDLVIEQAPLVAQEIITLGRIESVWGVVGSLIIGIICAVCCLVMSKQFIVGLKEDRAEFPQTVTMLAAMVSFILGTISLIVSVCSIDYLFEPWFAPRVYLIHEIGNLL